MNKKIKRYAAIAGIVLLLIIFCMPMLFAFGKSEDTQALFRGAVGVMMAAPILLYMFLIMYRIFGKKKTPEREIENIVFDVGQVLVKYDWETYLKGFHFSKEKYEKIADVVFRGDIWVDRDKGLLKEEEYVERMIERAPEYADDIREVMRRSPETIETMEYATAWVEYLKDQGYKLYILSNYGRYMMEENRPQMPFLKYMDGAIFSCMVGDIKPNLSIYKTLAKRYGLNMEKSVFLDDRLENCEAARKAGMHAIVFKDLKQAAAELEKLGVK